MVASLSCPAGSTHVLNCTSTPPVAGTCSHNQDAGIRCRNVSVCELAGHTSCCTGPEELCSVGECYCDALCHTFEDCCANIENTCSGENTSGAGTCLSVYGVAASAFNICTIHKLQN